MILLFDLDIIEKDWKKNSRALSEKEIIDIFKEDHATIPQYEESMKDWHKKLELVLETISAEERLLKKILGDRSEISEQVILAKYPEPQKQHLSKENQKRVVDGSMHLVFQYVRYYYNLFHSRIKQEILYYLLLETLINVAKYMVHCGDTIFTLYVIQSFENAITKYISNIEKVSFKEAKTIVVCYECLSFDEKFLGTPVIGENKVRTKEILEKHSLSYEKQEYPVNPFELKFLMKNEISKDELMERINTNVFFEDYNCVLESLNEDEKIVMQLSYDNYGYLGLTYEEIANFLGIEKNKVASIKKRALRNVRKNTVLNQYR